MGWVASGQEKRQEVEKTSWLLDPTCQILKDLDPLLSTLCHPYLFRPHYRYYFPLRLGCLWRPRRKSILEDKIMTSHPSNPLPCKYVFLLCHLPMHLPTFGIWSHSPSSWTVFILLSLTYLRPLKSSSLPQMLPLPWNVSKDHRFPDKPRCPFVESLYLKIDVSTLICR